MTARIVTQTNREPITLREFAQMPWLSDGDADAFEQNHLRPGQLWQRVAEGKPRGTSMRLATAINRAMSREPIGSDPIDMATIEAARGPRVAPGDIRSHRKTNTYRMCASGIIRAGVRIK